MRPELRLVNIARGAPRTPEARHAPPKVHSSKQTWGRSTPEEVDEMEAAIAAWRDSKELEEEEDFNASRE